ncbi:MAG TPA: hypothetical protein VMT52_16220, partial [Planctomycetota bacterium]|nr:hypothetical protein [Planctomycetota bacterium]
LCARLEAARTFSEARVPLEVIAREAKSPGVGRRFIESLGPRQPRATFWFFSYFLAEEDCQIVPGEKTQAKRPEVYGFLSEPFARRLIQDDKLLGMWGQYVYWRLGDILWPGMDFLGGVPRNRSWCLLQNGIRRDLFDAFEGEASFHREALSLDELTRALLYSSQALCSAEAWLLHLDPGELLEPGFSSVNLWTQAQAASKAMELRLGSWVTAHWQRLHYDPEQGRCVPLPAGGPPDSYPFQDRGYTAPSVPFIGWSGPVPDVPKLNV